MKSSVYRSFDLVAVITNFEKGEVVTIDPMVNNIYSVGSNFPYVCMHTKGKDVLVNTQTGEELVRSPGDNSLTNPVPVGEWRATLPEDVEIVCYSPFLNPNKVPFSSCLDPVVMSAGEKKHIPHMTKLFIASGSGEVNGNNFVGPRQVLFKSGDAELAATTDLYGFIVK